MLRQREADDAGCRMGRRQERALFGRASVWFPSCAQLASASTSVCSAWLLFCLAGVHPLQVSRRCARLSPCTRPRSQPPRTRPSFRSPFSFSSLRLVFFRTSNVRSRLLILELAPARDRHLPPPSRRTSSPEQREHSFASFPSFLISPSFLPSLPALRAHVGDRLRVFPNILLKCRPQLIKTKWRERRGAEQVRAPPPMGVSLAVPSRLA